MTRFEYIQRRFEFTKRGSELPQSKLTAEDAQNIRKLHAFKQAEIKRLNETLSAKAIAEKYGIHHRTVEKIISYETWKHA